MHCFIKALQRRNSDHKHPIFMLCLFFMTLTTPSEAARSPHCTAKGRHSRVADGGKKAMPIVALGVSLIKMDWVGAILSQVLAEGLYVGNRKFEHKIHKKRPCGCDGAFPSGHMIMYASSASYLHYRYGWQYGLPGYIAAIGFSYDRIRHKAHSWGDMLGTAAIVNLITYIVTPRYTDDVAYLPPAFSALFVSNESSRHNPEKKIKSTSSFISRCIPHVYAHKGVYTVGFTIQF